MPSCEICGAEVNPVEPADVDHKVYNCNDHLCKVCEEFKVNPFMDYCEFCMKPYCKCPNGCKCPE